MKTDYEMTGNLYGKLRSYIVVEDLKALGISVFWDSSEHFRTKKKYKQWLSVQKGWEHLKFEIRRGEQ